MHMLDSSHCLFIYLLFFFICFSLFAYLACIITVTEIYPPSVYVVYHTRSVIGKLERLEATFCNV